MVLDDRSSSASAFEVVNSFLIESRKLEAFFFCFPTGGTIMQVSDLLTILSQIMFEGIPSTMSVRCTASCPCYRFLCLWGPWCFASISCHWYHCLMHWNSALMYGILCVAGSTAARGVQSWSREPVMNWNCCHVQCCNVYGLQCCR